MSAESDERVRYAKDVETLDPEHPFHRIHDHVRPGDHVLDVGCASGALGTLLATTAEVVDGIEMNDERADVARQFLHKVVNAPAGPEVDAELPGPYDVVVFADVLEHIPDPEPALRWAASKLTADGKILALVPNSANWKFRRKILKGDWSYEDTGYFDRDHVRFFDTATARALGPGSGLEEVGVEYIPGRLPKPLDSWPKGMALATKARPNLFAGHVLVEWKRP